MELVKSMLSTASQYGIAIFVLMSLNVALVSFIFLAWKQGIKEREELFQVIKDNTAAYTKLQETINTLIQVIKHS
ncbi:hypothetical protein LX64_04191 [Chitinophaga skermanii]|uniref:Uncharacterized protein n=1 Tax=Chitinophaga skermanii TaxID=331697 RepID=A0A327Q974_9BACT|nr:hypothetical protein [Chitinophaga skermanii]RAJ00485.1 hypothetical protein LX64_04191 [Chitinophaga skermanii]